MLPTALNYATAAIEDLNKLRDHFRLRESHMALKTLTESIRRSEKFVLPLDASLLEVPDIQEHYLPLLRLPYPFTVLEFATTPERNGGSKKGLVLCISGSEVPDMDTSSDNPALSIFFTPLFFSETQRLWQPTAHTYWFNPEHIELVDGKIIKGIHCLDFIPEILQGMPPERATNEANFNMKFGLDAIVEMLLTCNCSNIGTNDLVPPAQLNKKREKNSREPLYTYKVLTIPGEHHERSDISNSDRTERRMHLRRGHIRQLQSGRAVWVRHAVIGNPERGVVVKDYKVATPD